MRKSKKIKFALMSVADIKNYGDTLFPFVVRNKLLKSFPNSEIRFFTPSDSILENEKFYNFSIENLNDFAPDVILVVGGEVIHKYDNMVWQEMYHNKISTPSNVIFGWLDYPAKFKAWFSVGVLDLETPMDSKISDEELEKLNYIGVRGILSKKILEKKHSLLVNRAIDIVPDIGWTFAKHFKSYFLELLKLSIKHKYIFFPNKYIVFNINFTSIPENLIIPVLDTLRGFTTAHRLNVVIIDVISSYKNVNADIEAYVKQYDNIIYLRDCNLNQMGAILCGCRFYIGSSLHCAMTTLSNNKPAGLIHNATLTKFQDMYGHMMNYDLYSNNWNELNIILQKLYFYNSKRKNIQSIYVKFMQEMFEYKWITLMNNIKNILK